MPRIFLSILFCLCVNIAGAQLINNKLIKLKGDSVLKAWVGNGINRLVIKFKEGYHNKNDNRAIYTISYPDNKYADGLVIYFDSNFNVIDSNFFRSFPDYVLEDRPNDLMPKDSAVAIAKKAGLCMNDILEISFYRLYNAKPFVWVIRTDNKKERREAKLKAGYRRTVTRVTSACKTRTVNALTGEIIETD